jgi:hypothetical protein
MAIMTESEFEARRTKWEQNPGPCVGDWYVMKNGRRHRFGRDLGESLKLADTSSGRKFCLNPDGVVTYWAGLLDYPAIQKLPLEGKALSKRERGAVWWHQDPPSVQRSVMCRVFKEK